VFSLLLHQLIFDGEKQLSLRAALDFIFHPSPRARHK